MDLPQLAQFVLTAGGEAASVENRKPNEVFEQIANILKGLLKTALPGVLTALLGPIGGILANLFGGIL